ETRGEVERNVVGKTIAAAELYGGVVLRFSDGTWAYADLYGDEDGGELDWSGVPTPTDLLGVGVIDRAEFEAMVAEAEGRRLAQIEAAERSQYERLRAKFERPQGG